MTYQLMLIVRNLPKDKFKKRIGTLLFDILESDDSYYNLKQIIGRVKNRASQL